MLWDHHRLPCVVRDVLELVEILFDIPLELVDISDDVEYDHKRRRQDDSSANECADNGVLENSTHLKVGFDSYAKFGVHPSSGIVVYFVHSSNGI